MVKSLSTRWNSSGKSSQQYASGLVVVREQSENVEVGSSHDDVPYVRPASLVFDADEDYADYEEDQDNDLEQSDDVSLVVDSSPYREAVIHNNDEYSVVRPRNLYSQS